MTRFSLLIMAILAVGMGYPAGAGTHVLPSLATDQADYSPGSRASVSGTGFRPGETIRLQVLQINTADNKGPEHQPWKIKADPTGGFKDIWPVATHEAGATLRLTAAGLSSGRMAEKIFTDAAITPASGGGAISANSYNSAFTVLTGPVIVETVIGDINTGTLVLTAPAGFIFDTNAPLPIMPPWPCRSAAPGPSPRRPGPGCCGRG